MNQVIAGMSVSLDGFVADAQGVVTPLYPDMQSLRATEYMAAMVAETGSVLMGRRTFDMAGDPDWYVGNYEHQRPIVVVTHNAPPVPPKQDARLTFTFVTTGLEDAVAEARAAAGDLAVNVVGGPALFGQLLAAGLVDELRIDLVPVILGQGLPLFQAGRTPGVDLDKISVEEVGARTSLRFRVRR